MQQNEISQNDVIEMAKQAGASPDGKLWLMYSEDIEDFAKLIADAATAKEREFWSEQGKVDVEEAIRDEREACAKICDDKHHTWRWDNEPDSPSGPRDCAAAIRARGEA